MRVVAKADDAQIELMLARSSIVIIFAPGALAGIGIDSIVFRPFTPTRGRIVIRAARGQRERPPGL